MLFVLLFFFAGKKKEEFFFFSSLANQTHFRKVGLVCETNLQVARECGCDSEVHLVLPPGAGKHQPRGSCDNHYSYSRLQVCLQVSQVASASPNPRGRVWSTAFVSHSDLLGLATRHQGRLQVSWVVVV